MKKLYIIPAICFTLLLSGCMGSEPNDIAYIVAMGFDTAEYNNYKITLQFAKPTQISGGASEEGGKGGDIVENVTVEAPNIYSGINIANNIVSKKLSMSHEKLMIFSEEVASNGLNDIMETLSKSYEVRPDMYLAVSKSEAGEFLNSVKPVIEVNPAKYYQLTFEESGGIGIPKNIAQDFYFCKNRLYKDGILPLAGVIGTNEEEKSNNQENEENQENSDESSISDKTENNNQIIPPLNENGFEFKLKDYIAGTVGIKETNKSEAMGMALFKEGKLVGTMGGIESELYNILNGSFDYGYISFYSKKSPQTPIAIKLQQNKKPKIKVDVKEKKVDINLYLEADLFSLPDNYATEKDITSFENESKNSIKKACEKFLNETINEYNVDILGIIKKAKRNYLTYEEFEKQDWSSAFSDYEINVNPNFYIRRAGMTIREN